MMSCRGNKMHGRKILKLIDLVVCVVCQQPWPRSENASGVAGFPFLCEVVDGRAHDKALGSANQS